MGPRNVIAKIFRIIGLPLYFGFVGISLIVFAISQISLRGVLPKITLSLILSILIFYLSVAFFWNFFMRSLPRPDELSKRNIDVTTKIYDKNGVLLYKLFKDKDRTLVHLADVPLHVRLATLAAEDAEFYNHPGFSIKGMGRAIIKFAKDGRITSGSTITQQLVKNALLSPEKTLWRKVREVLIAIAVEQKYSKDEILEMYLNEVSYGGTAYGIAEASQYYFNKPINELSLAQAALLAGLPKSPSLLSPHGTDPDLAQKRKDEVLGLMKNEGYISGPRYDEAMTEHVEVVPHTTDIKAPHFVFYVRELLVKMYGEEIFTKGYEVTTTLDINIQNLAEEAVAREVDKLTNLKVGNGAALVIDPKKGEILAMVGSKNYFAQDIDGNVNVTLMPRQPGSSIKVVNYAYALSHGFTAMTLLDDSPVKFEAAGTQPYVPKNYDNKYRGKITLRSALAESRNIPAVRVLNSIGVSNMIQMGRKMGINSWSDPSRFGLSLTLGGGEVTLLELSSVYTTLANSGNRPEFSAIKEIKNSEDKVIFTHKPTETQALDPRVAFILTDILRDNDARSPAFGSHSALVIPNHREIAVKTGTSNDLRDNLTVGYNQNYLVAVWVGNNNNAPMSRVASGITGASPIWNSIMTNLVADASNHPWEIPAGLVQKKVCGRTEWFLEESSVPQNCTRPTPSPE